MSDDLNPLEVVKGGRILNTMRKALGIHTSSERMEAAVERDWTAWVEEAVIGWHRFQAEWERRSPESRPTASDVMAVLTAAKEVYRDTADSKKREQLRHAVVNAFDPEVYDDGLTLRLVRLMRELEYGDIVVLIEIVPGAYAAADPKGRTLGRFGRESPWSHHLDVLVRHGLAQTKAQPGTPEWSTGTFEVEATWLGRRLLRLLNDPNATDLDLGTAKGPAREE